jgi:DNA-binding NtrC family response regulator
MPFRSTEWAYLVRHKPDQAKKKILAAYEKSKGNAVQAAEHLEVSHRSLTRMVGELKLTEQVADVRSKHGFLRGGAGPHKAVSDD